LVVAGLVVAAGSKAVLLEVAALLAVAVDGGTWKWRDF
jgi:hypothetical protein